MGPILIYNIITDQLWWKKYFLYQHFCIYWCFDMKKTFCKKEKRLHCKAKFERWLCELSSCTLDATALGRWSRFDFLLYSGKIIFNASIFVNIDVLITERLLKHSPIIYDIIQVKVFILLFSLNNLESCSIEDKTRDTRTSMRSQINGQYFNKNTSLCGKVKRRLCELSQWARYLYKFQTNFGSHRNHG